MSISWVCWRAYPIIRATVCKLKCRPPLERARCSSWLETRPLLSLSMKSNHCTVHTLFTMPLHEIRRTVQIPFKIDTKHERHSDNKVVPINQLYGAGHVGRAGGTQERRWKQEQACDPRRSLYSRSTVGSLLAKQEAIDRPEIQHKQLFRGCRGYLLHTLISHCACPSAAACPPSTGTSFQSDTNEPESGRTNAAES